MKCDVTILFVILHVLCINTWQICVTGATGSMLESWLAKKEQNPQLHRIFQQMAVNLALEKSTRWQFVTKSQHLQKVSVVDIN